MTTEDFLKNIGKIIKIDSQGRLSLGIEFANQEVFVFYDLTRKNSFILCSALYEGEGFLKFSLKPFKTDNKGRFFLPYNLKNIFNGALLLKRHKYVVVIPVKELL